MWFILVKISDFGLSRQTAEYKIKTAVKLPIKWLAPETINSFTFTQKTDVYSYGVMVHEIFADGAEPWEGIPNGEVKKAVTEGKMLPMKEVPDKVRSFCRERIFPKDPTQRAEMADVVRFFQATDPSSANKSEEHGASSKVSVISTTTKKKTPSKNN